MSNQENRQTNLDKIVREQKSNNSQDNGSKFKVGYAVLGVLGVSGLIYLTTRLIKKGIAANSDKKSFQEGTPSTIAKQIKMAFDNDGQFGTDTKALRDLLTKQIKSRKELDQVRAEYQKQFNSQLYSDMSKELQSSEYREMLQIMEGKPEKPGAPLSAKQFTAWAKRLKAAFDKVYSFIPGTDEGAICAVFNEVPTQAAFISVGKAYQQEYKRDFIKDLKSELEIWEYADFMKIITSKPKK
ncbi:MAG TPA: hypothetical protein PLE32_22880 [Haliscomenobacter sp.]|nr:hypothetical protein [Haliscomenobacter sp.]